MIHLTLLAFAVLPVLPLAPASEQITLASLRHDYRPLLIFAASDSPQLREQLEILAPRTQEAQDRHIVVVPMMLREDEQEKDTRPWSEILPAKCFVELAAGESASARKRFQTGEQEFTVILLGKDGGEKLRSQTPVTMERLAKLIDSMPTRQKEIRDGHAGQL
jgi:Domain of unknown function (DUF4174)